MGYVIRYVLRVVWRINDGDIFRSFLLSLVTAFWFDNRIIICVLLMSDAA